MELFKLIGVLMVVIGFILKFDAMATVVAAGVATGLIAGMTPADILSALGSSFISNRTATLFVLTLPVIGLCERNGLKEKAVDLIGAMKNATAGRLVALYQIIRAIAAALSLRVGGHPQFVRPLIYPMAQGAAVVRYEELDEAAEDHIKALCAASENYGNFFAQNCFMGASGPLLIASTMTEQGYPVTPLQVSAWAALIAVFSVAVGMIRNLLFDRKLDKRLTRKSEIYKPEIRESEMRKPELHESDLKKPEVHESDPHKPQIRKSEISKPEKGGTST